MFNGRLLSRASDNRLFSNAGPELAKLRCNDTRTTVEVTSTRVLYCFVTNPKNLPAISLYHILITANMQWKTGFPSSHQLKSYTYVAPKSRLKFAARCPENWRPFCSGRRSLMRSDNVLCTICSPVAQCWSVTMYWLLQSACCWHCTVVLQQQGDTAT